MSINLVNSTNRKGVTWQTTSHPLTCKKNGLFFLIRKLCLMLFNELRLQIVWH